MKIASIRSVGVIVLTLSGLILTATLAAQAPVYTAEYLGSAVNAAAMNPSGQVVGSTSFGQNLRGWMAGPGQPIVPLPLPAGYSSSSANDINDAGVIVGAVAASTSPEFGGVAAVWTPNGSGGYSVATLGMLPGHQRSDARALNNVGDIVGYSVLNSFRHAVVFTAPGGIQSLDPLGIFDPQSINDDRVLVDRSFDSKRLDLDTMVVDPVGVPPGSYAGTESQEINASGQVAGLVILTTSSSCNRAAARYTDGPGWEVFSGCGSGNGAYDLNDLGDVVMRLNVAPYVRLEGLGTFPIEDLIDESGGHWSVINGYGLTINNARQMVVPASNGLTGQGGLILLTPLTPTGGSFVRGDANSDGSLDLSDPIFELVHLFVGTPADCLEALDANDDGTVNIADPVHLLTFLFAGGTPPPAPFPACGTDSGPAGLPCDAFPACP